MDMHSTSTFNAMRRTFATMAAVVASVALAACAEQGPVGPEHRAPVAATIAASIEEDTGSTLRAPELGNCSDITVPEGNKLALRLYATGVQVYRWNGTSWGFVEPVATLYADAGFNGEVGTHFRGPKWRSTGGSEVAGSEPVRCDVPGTIQWLRLKATPTAGPGIFERTTFIQRVETTAGTAPQAPGSYAGEEKGVPYTAVYLFYRAQ
jgi:predicted small lipoprotein YifL